jgi:DNA polymerase-3 subunit epsilon
VSPLRLERPLAVFDLETTGTDPMQDRIVELSVLRLDPDGGRELRTRRINPGRPIPPEASAVHGIRDEDVRDAPSFRQIGRSLLDFLDGADLAGFNVRRFDLPLLEREFRDCGLDLGAAGRRVIDAMTVFHRKEPRDLAAAVGFYLGREHEGAHGAEADVVATLEVLEAQVERYDDVPDDVAALADWLERGRGGSGERRRFVRRDDGELLLAFGKHRGRTLREVAASESRYLEWILQSDFPEDDKQLVRDALSEQVGQAPPRAVQPPDQSPT